MNSIQLEKILKCIIPSPSVKCLGVFPHDHTQFLVAHTLEAHSFPICFVSNTHPSGFPGEHWVAFYYTSENSAEFFDSYGNAPSDYDFNIQPCFSNPRMLQREKSTVCGQYCIFYLYHRSRGKTMTQILTPFSGTDLAYNDRSVARFVRNLTSSNKIYYSYIIIEFEWAN